MKDFAEFTLEEVITPFLRNIRDALVFIRDALVFILILMLFITAILAIPGGIAAGGSYLAYKAGLPYNIPLAIGTAALTAIWYLILIALMEWISDSGDTWRANRSARNNRGTQEETTNPAAGTRNTS